MSINTRATIEIIRLLPVKTWHLVPSWREYEPVLAQVTGGVQTTVVMALDYAPPVPGTRQALPILGSVAAIGGLFGFLIFMAIDICFVWFAPSHINDYDWTGFAFPFVIGSVAAYRVRFLDTRRRILLSFACAVLASAILVALAIVPGLWIHLKIGGEL